MEDRKREGIERFVCLRCGYEWIGKPQSRDHEAPAQCPRCHSMKWDEPRRPSGG